MPHPKKAETLLDLECLRGVRGTGVKADNYKGESNRFAGHDARMAAHKRAVWDHPCERVGRKPCTDCIRTHRET